ncbi:MAG TPA: hypothetical protein VF535_07595 [Allosphingosinicella sp.]|jgi:hypothetical protein
MALANVSLRDGKRWARAPRGALQRIGDSLGRLRYIRFDLHAPTLPGLARGLSRITVWAGLATAPFWIDFFDKKDVPKDHLVLYSAIMFALLVANWILDTFIKSGARRRRLQDHRETAAIEHRNLVNEMLKVVAVPAANLGDAVFMGVVARTLRVILQRIREELDTLDASYLEASLLLFQPNNQIEIVERAVRNRAIGSSVERTRTMAYFVAQARRDWKHVPDLKREELFNFEGISDPSCPYRSILFIPIIYAEPRGSTAVGVVTIDSARPYEFWNEAVTDRLYKQVMPFVRLLAILFQSHSEKVQCA